MHLIVVWALVIMRDIRDAAKTLFKLDVQSAS
jgi:hypothetical protein